MNSHLERARRALFSHAGLPLWAAALAVVAFVPSWTGPFLFDDVFLIANNSAIHSLERFWDWWQGDLFDVRLKTVQLASRQPYYRPLVVVSYGLNWWLAPASSLSFHLTNCLLHGWTTYLAFYALRRWSLGPGPAFWATLIFALHPTKAESVAWISGRTDVLCAFFVLLSCWAYSRQLSFSGTFGRRRILYACAAAGFGLCAVLSKETALVLPAFLAVEVWAHAGHPGLAKWRELKAAARQAGRGLLPLVLCCVGYLALRAAWLPLLKAGPIHGTFALTHWKLMLEVLGQNARFLVFPHDLSLYGTRLRFSDAHVTFEPTLVFIGGGVLILLLVLCWRALRPQPATSVLCLLFLVCLAPTSGLVPSALATTAQARFLYLPLLPLAGAFVVAWGARPLLVHGMGVVVAGGLLALSLSRSADFRSSDSFWSYELRHNPAVPEVLRHFVAADAKSEGLAFSQRRALCAARISEQSYRSESVAWFLEHTLRSATSLLPDSSPQLIQVARFLRDARKGSPTPLREPVGFSVAPNSRTARDLERASLSLLQFEAELRQRAGQTKDALRLAKQAIRQCPKCEDVKFQLARVALFAGEAQLGRSWLESLSARSVKRYEDASGMMEQRAAARGPDRLLLSLGVASALQVPDFAAREVDPLLEKVLTAPPQMLARVFQAAWAAGRSDLTVVLFPRLSPSEQARQKQSGWKWPRVGPSRAFVPGTCALAREL